MYGKKFILYGGIIMGIIKEGVLPEACSIIRTLTVPTWCGLQVLQIEAGPGDNSLNYTDTKLIIILKISKQIDN